MKLRIGDRQYVMQKLHDPQAPITPRGFHEGLESAEAACAARDEGDIALGEFRLAPDSATEIFVGDGCDSDTFAAVGLAAGQRVRGGKTQFMDRAPKAGPVATRQKGVERMRPLVAHAKKGAESRAGKRAGRKGGIGDDGFLQGRMIGDQTIITLLRDFLEMSDSGRRNARNAAHAQTMTKVIEQVGNVIVNHVRAFSGNSDRSFHSALASSTLDCEPVLRRPHGRPPWLFFDYALLWLWRGSPPDFEKGSMTPAGNEAAVECLCHGRA